MATYSSRMSYLEPWNPSNGSPYVRGNPDQGFKPSNYSNLEYPVQVTDARPTRDQYTTNIHGFAFHDSVITDEILQAIRANDKERVAKEYYPLVEKVIKEKTGAKKVVIFDHTVRRRDPSLSPKDNPNGREQPASLVHCDQSPVGAIKRVYRHTGDEADQLLQGRVEIINVWRPINGPVEEWPLAMMDYRSLKLEDVQPTNIFKKQYEPLGQTVSICYSQDHRWYFLSEQTPEEVTFIKIWDSKEDVEAKLCAHCAFPHPETPENARLRESVEVRCLVFYDS